MQARHRRISPLKCRPSHWGRLFYYSSYQINAIHEQAISFTTHPDPNINDSICGYTLPCMDGV